MIPEWVSRHSRYAICNRWLAYGFFVLASAVLCLCFGKDLNWDSLNYHYYSGFSALHERATLDYMAAGPQGYMNPWSYVPFYWMVSHDWPPPVVAVCLAVFQSLGLVLVYEIGMLVVPGRSEAIRHALSLIAGLIGLANPIYLQQLGSTFSDSSVAVLVLFGVWALLRSGAAEEWVGSAQIGLLLLAGFAMGAASGLKLSSALYAIAMTPAALIVRRVFPLQGFAVYALGGIGGFLATDGPWAVRMWTEMGNPLFPFLNELFRSPDFTTESVKHQRFLPTDWFELLMRPIRIALPIRLTQTELYAPDVRYAAFLLLSVSALLVGIRRDRVGVRVGGALDADRGRLLLVGSGCFVLSWLMWLSSSGNGRYFVPMAGFVGALGVGWISWMLGSKQMRAIWAGLALLACQTFVLIDASETRWNPSDWGEKWFDVELPAGLRDEAVTLVSMDSQTASFLVPFLRAGSGAINISGGHPLVPGSPGGDRAARFLADNLPRLRSLILITSVRGDGSPIAPNLEIAGGKLARFGLKLNERKCETVRVRGRSDAIPVTGGDGVESERSEDAWMYWLSCPIVAGEGPNASERAEKARMDLVFDRIEAACPNIFSPRGAPTERSGPLWQRTYSNSDTGIWSGPLGIHFYNSLIGGDPVPVGRLEDWEREPQPIDCSRRYMRAFGFLDLRQ